MQEAKITEVKKKTTAKKTTKKAAVKPEVKEETVKAIPAEDKAEAVDEVKKETVSEVEALKQQIEMLKQQIALQAQVQPQVIVSAASSERIHFLWLANVADENVVEFGPNGMYGRIVGKTGSFYMPKDEFSRILDSAARYYLDQRWLIVVSGLDKNEREALGVDYKEGELLDVDTFRKIAKMPRAELCEVYKELCESHQNMVAARLHEEFENGKRIDREMVVALNRIHSSVALKDIIEKMNENDLKTD